ncbi:MAG: tyrosine-type recombinase/integrase [Lachnospiraceae bacterium]|nr:tyrosine-type recombinase/integrase [Lachnospiraceae bacterium]
MTAEAFNLFSIVSFYTICREQITVKKFDGVSELCEIVDHTKTHKNRIYPMTDALSEFLTRLNAVLNRYYPNSPFLFPADTENGVITNNTVYRQYFRICRELGIEISREVVKGTHSFRRNAITHLINTTGGDVFLTSQVFLTKS